MINQLKKLDKIFLGGQYVFAYSFVDKFTYFFFYLILARTIPQSEYGFIVTIFAFTSILQIIFDFGFPFYIQRETAGKDKIQSKLNTLISFKLLVFIIYLIIPIIYFQITTANKNIFLVIIISVINYIAGINVLLNSVFYGKQFYKQSFVALFLPRIILIIIFVILAFIIVETEILLLIFLLSLIIHFYLEVRYLQKLNIKIKLSEFNWKELKEIFPSSIKIGLGLIFVLIYDRIDIIILQNIIGLESVAIYSIAYSLFRGLQIFSAPLFMPRYTDYSKYFSVNKYLSLNEIKNTLKIIFLFSFIIVLFTFILAKPIILFLYTTKYFSSISILQWLSIALLGVFLNNFTGIISNSMRREIIPLISTITCAIINIILNLILIPKFAIMGAVISTIITEYLVFFMQLVMLIFLNNKLAIIRK
ncbi:MAG: flippase [Ignavibacterium sp.]